MAKDNLLQIDGQKLSRALAIRKLDRRTASEEMGYNPNYITKCISNGKISKPSVQLLKTLYDIDFDEYAYREPEPVQTVIEEIAPDKTDYDRLYITIFAAVSDALKSYKTEAQHEGDF